MRYPANRQFLVIMAFCLAAFCSTGISAASAAIQEAAVNVHLRVVNKCSMSVTSAENQPDIDVHCTKPAAFHIRVHQNVVLAENQQYYRQVVVSY